VRHYHSRLSLSPDGERLAVTIRTATENGLWLYDLDRSTLEPLSRGGEASGPIWSPNGRQVVFRWLENGQYSLRSQHVDGSAPETLTMTALYPASWSPQGNVLGVVLHSTPVNGVLTGWDLMVASLESESPGPRPLLQTADHEDSPDLSPDGRWLAYASNRTGRFEVYVQPYPGPGPRTAVSVDGGSNPAWHPRGGELFYVTLPDADGKGRMMVVEFEAGLPPRIGTPRPLFQYDPSELQMHCMPTRCYDVSPDGQRFYVVQATQPPPPPVVTHINLVLNWFEELKAKVPVR
jgi:Tol biopolymer transport system component